MPTLIPSKYCQWQLEEREAIEGQILTFNQRCVIQNHISQLAKEKIELTFTHKEANEYWQREAELQGQIGILEHLLQCADSAVEELDAYIQATGNRDMSHVTGASSSPFTDATYGNSSDTPSVE